MTGSGCRSAAGGERGRTVPKAVATVSFGLQ